ncbi:MAG: HNH endonuclease [Actinobacteria bacterium]|nr:HNH endonuclease [Actinomycetota bacterium]MBE3114623.1 HNH endonuclease [Actinomycetota bacterium]
MRKFGNKIELNSIRYGLWQLEYTDREIASILNIPLGTINNWRKNLNLQSNYKDDIRDSLGRFIKGVKWDYWKNRKPRPKGLKYNIICDNRNWFKNGHQSWNEGKQLSKETKRKLSESKIGKHYSPNTEFKKGQTSGENNNNWKGGITPLVKSIRQLPESIKWKKEIYKRDDWTCQMCNKRGISLHTHHKISFSTIIDKYDIKSIIDAINCKLLWDISNGTTLCKSCHKKCHSKNNKLE